MSVPFSAWPGLEDSDETDECTILALIVLGRNKGGYVLRASDDELYSFCLRDVRNLLPSAIVQRLKKAKLWAAPPRPAQSHDHY